MSIALCTLCFKPSHFKCAGCEGIRYCSRECQRTDWKRHKESCGEFTKQDGREALRLEKTFATQISKAINVLLLADGIPSKVKYQIQIDPISGCTSYATLVEPFKYEDPGEPWISIRIGHILLRSPLTRHENHMTIEVKKFRMQIRKKFAVMLRDGYSRIEAYQAIFDDFPTR